jgi:hypothetical protein
MNYLSDRKYLIGYSFILFILIPSALYGLSTYFKFPWFLIWLLILNIDAWLYKNIMKSKSERCMRIKRYIIVANYRKERAKLNTTRGQDEMDI